MYYENQQFYLKLVGGGGVFKGSVFRKFLVEGLGLAYSLHVPREGGGRHDSKWTKSSSDGRKMTAEI